MRAIGDRPTSDIDVSSCLPVPPLASRTPPSRAINSGPPRTAHVVLYARNIYGVQLAGPVKIEFCCKAGCLFSPRARRRAAGARTRRGRRTSSHKIFHTKPCRIGGSRPRIRWAMRGLTELRGRRRVPRVKLHVDVAGAALEALNPRRLP